uniref:Immunoglobulin superfamily containing leucine rich repeat n=1 Tax=Latimeria chalumnae TaxID=7897 RepID=H3A9J1_LATCH
TMENFLFLYALCAAVLGGADGCPEPCVCVDKYAHQFADCAYKDLRVVPVGLPSNVTTLSLSANKIQSLAKDSFVDVTQVSSLWLAHNNISTIEKGTLAVLLQLKNLDVSHNKIVAFPWQDLYNLRSLQLLKMNNNEMTTLPRDAFATLKDLRSLRINNNRFTTIDEGTFDSLTSLSHLQIYNNPFLCSCKLTWLRKWIENAVISIPEEQSIVCSAPEEMKGISVTKIPNLQCVAPTAYLTYHPNLDNTELYDGFMLVLYCNATGSPTPEIKWKLQTTTKDTEVLEPNVEAEVNTLPAQGAKQNKERFLIYKNGTFVIPHLSKREEGTYTCLATNEVGSNQTSVNVAVAGSQKHPTNAIQDPTIAKIPPSDRKTGAKTYKNNVINWPNAEDRTWETGPTSHSYTNVDTGGNSEGFPSKMSPFEKKCGPSDSTQYISNHAFNQSNELKQHSFDFGVITLDVAETEAKMQLTPFHTQSENAHLEMLYLCKENDKGHSVVQWSKIEDGVNSYQFQGLNPGTNYTLCLTYKDEDCQVQVVFTTKKKIPSLLIIIVVSTFLLGLATIPLLGATCCHLLYKYQGKTYKLIMKTQNPDHMEKHMAADFDPRASFQESEKNFNPSEMGEGEGSVVAESIPESQSKVNQEEFEVGSEYSDRLPLGAEAVNISQEINGNYRQPA